MPKFKYSAKDLKNLTVRGELEAADKSDLYTRLREQALVLVDASEVEQKTNYYRFKAREIADFSRQMAEMLASGLTVAHALNILRERDAKPKMRDIYDIVYKNILNGMPLSEAAGEMGNTFPTLFVNMCNAGEASGQLEKTMRKMSEHYEKEDRLNRKIKSAATYPIVLLTLTVGAMLLIFMVIMPMFFQIFEGMELPLLTRIVMGLSDFMLENWLTILLVAFAIPFLVRYLLSVPSIRVWFDKTKFKIPIIKGPLRIIYTARFARTLSSLYSSGLPLVNSLSISSALTGNKHLEVQFPDVIKSIRNGDSLSESISRIQEFDPKLATTINIGEETGRLVQMLESTADTYDYEADMATSRLVSLLEPIMIIVMAVLIGVVLISVMTPIFSLYGQINNAM